MVLVQIPLSWIREIRNLTVTNALANTLIMYGLILCVLFAFEEAVDPALDEEAAEDGGLRGPAAELFYKFFHLKPFNSSGWFLFIGTSVSVVDYDLYHGDSFSEISNFAIIEKYLTRLARLN